MPDSPQARLFAAGLVAWLIVSTMILWGDAHTVTTAYAHGSLAWINGQNMYETTGEGFLYLPQAALLYAPFAALPAPAGDLVWRLACLTIFLLGVARFAELAPGEPQRVLLHVSAISLAMCANGLRLGQSTLPMTGCMLLAAEALSRQSWNRAAAWLLLGLAVKPLTIVLVLLAAALHSPLRWRLLGGCALLAVTPFCTQHPAYVVWQYGQFGEMLQHANELGNHAWWAQLFGMLKTFGQPVSPAAQTAARAAAALVTLVLCSGWRSAAASGGGPRSGCTRWPPFT